MLKIYAIRNAKTAINIVERIPAINGVVIPPSLNKLSYKGNKKRPKLTSYAPEE